MYVQDIHLLIFTANRVFPTAFIFQLLYPKRSISFLPYVFRHVKYKII